MPSPAQGSDLKSTHKAALFLEAGLSLQASELSVPAETRPNNLTITFDSEAGTATIAATLPVSIQLDNSGKAIVQAVDYIP